MPRLASSKRPMRRLMAPVNRAFLVAEELTLKQVGRDCCAVEVHERVDATARVVDGACDEALSRPFHHE